MASLRGSSSTAKASAGTWSIARYAAIEAMQHDRRAVADEVIERVEHPGHAGEVDVEHGVGVDLDRRDAGGDHERVELVDRRAATASSDARSVRSQNTSPPARSAINVVPVEEGRGRGPDSRCAPDDDVHVIPLCRVRVR